MARTVKLIRNKRGSDTPSHAAYLRKGGEPYNSYVVDDAAGPIAAHFLMLGLVAKLHEEVEEVHRALDDAEEYADVLQALFDLAKLNGISPSDIYLKLDEKEITAGGFTPGKVMVR